ncbi:SMI1/KNR4 family protein [Streptomyces sp. NPDC059340]|uniref:SMI1/KNR4 family protein n=1 Tax=unclassified Streptomyces TaxID=2593676 RepID=UPI0015EEE3B0|nr:SMI1/KNR4 family protein [Streptomyces sp. WAC00263]
MEFEEFEVHLSATRAKRAGLSSPEGIDVFESRVASEAELLEVEESLRVQLPSEYREFMKRHGGGMFLFLDLLPVVAPDAQEDDLRRVNAAEFKDGSFVAVAPVGTGDWWGFAVHEGRCANQVDFWDHEDGQVQFAATGFLEFLAREGLRVGR